MIARKEKKKKRNCYCCLKSWNDILTVGSTFLTEECTWEQVVYEEKKNWSFSFFVFILNFYTPYWLKCLSSTINFLGWFITQFDTNVNREEIGRKRFTFMTSISTFSKQKQKTFLSFFFAEYFALSHISFTRVISFRTLLQYILLSWKYTNTKLDVNTTKTTAFAKHTFLNEQQRILELELVSSNEVRPYQLNSSCVFS